MRLPRFLRDGESDSPDEVFPLRRALFWVTVWVGILLGLVLYCKYARHLVPVLA